MLVSLVSNEVHKLFHIIVGFVYRELFLLWETLLFKHLSERLLQCDEPGAKPDSLNDLNRWNSCFL